VQGVEFRECRSELAGGAQRSSRLQFAVRTLRQVTADELAYDAQGLGTDELIDDSTVPEQFHRRDAADRVLRGDAAFLVGIEFHDLEPRGFCRQLVEYGSEGSAGAAPWGPEVHQYRFEARLLNHFALEGGAGDTADLAHVANSETRHNALLWSIGSAHHFSTGRREDDEVPGYLGDRNYAHDAEHRLRVLAG
jgi:hypothetical protein